MRLFAPRATKRGLDAKYTSQCSRISSPHFLMCKFALSAWKLINRIRRVS